ncbi:MAG: isochorismatase family cysteine hydrolase [Anaeromyxobacteraceae bacterium]
MAEQLTLDRRTTAMVVVDMQNAFLDPKGSLGRMGVPMERTRRPVPHVERLLVAARSVKVPVVHLRFVLQKDLADLGVLGVKFPPLRELGHCAEGSWDADYYPGMKPEPGDHELVKNRFSGFHGTGLDSLLRNLHVDTLVVCGVATNVCVECTVRDAFMHDYRVVVPAEATGSYTEEMEAHALAAMAFSFATVTRVDEVVRALHGP